MRYLFIICFFFQILSTSAVSQGFKYHSVEKGETVYSIAKIYNISEEAIYKYNPDAKDGIEVSSKLVIPMVADREEASAPSNLKFITHKVARKETLYSLSKKYEVEIAEIKRFNKHLYSEELRTGEKIMIPVRQIATKESPVRRSPQQTGKRLSGTREHVVIPKETKYGIARKYGLTVRELEAMNPKVKVLKPGVMLKVGNEVLDQPVILMSDSFEFYEVKPQETIYGLTKKFEVDKDSLYALNPALKEGLRSGMVLKVPNKGEGLGDLAISETEEFSTEEYKEDAGAVLDLKRSLTNFDTKELVIMLPYHLDKVQTDSLQTYKSSILNERVVRISLDFYSGVLMAVEDAKKMGISTNLRVYDTRQNPKHVRSIINSYNLNNADVVIGPLLQSTTEAAAAGLNSYRVPVISPLSNRAMRPMDNLFQSRPTDEMMQEAILKYLQKNIGNKNLVVVVDAGSYDLKTKLGYLFPSAKFVNPGEGFVSEQNLAAALKANSENWILLQSENVGVLSSATSALNRLARTHNISLFSTKKNNGYENDNVSNDHLGKLHFHYPSVDKEFDSRITNGFIEQFKEKYGVTPNQYAVRGYDLTLDVLLRLASSGDLYKSFETYRGYTEYNENKFRYLPLAGGGYQNDAVYIIKVNEDLTLSVVNDL